MKGSKLWVIVVVFLVVVSFIVIWKFPSALEKLLGKPISITVEGIEKNDRYHIFFSPIVRADTFLVDTKEGKVWQMVQSKGEFVFWQKMIVEGSEEMRELAERLKKQKEEETAPKEKHSKLYEQLYGKKKKE